MREFNCDVERLDDDSELVDTKRSWMVSIDSPALDETWMQVCFSTEEEACEFQRAWRKLHGRDPMTGATLVSKPFNIDAHSSELPQSPRMTKAQVRERAERVAIRVLVSNLDGTVESANEAIRKFDDLVEDIVTTMMQPEEPVGDSPTQHKGN